MEVELAEPLGAERHERTTERTGYRNGYRARPWYTRPRIRALGTIELQVPRVRDGSFVPSFLESRRRAERALVAVVQEAYIQRISTRRVDDLVQAPRWVATLSRAASTSAGVAWDVGFDPLVRSGSPGRGPPVELVRVLPGPPIATSFELIVEGTVSPGIARIARSSVPPLGPPSVPRSPARIGTGLILELYGRDLRVGDGLASSNQSRGAQP